MKELCSRLMKLNIDFPFGQDYSAIALALYLRELGFDSKKKYDMNDYALYLYRFYSDIEIVRLNHYHKMINNIYHYRPSDFFEYTKKVLEYVQNTSELVVCFGNYFELSVCPDEVFKYEKILDGVIQTLVTKYIGKDYVLYHSGITEKDYIGKDFFEYGDKVFFRALELTNYCFLCDECRLDNLVAVKLRTLKEYNKSNYLIMCKEHSKEYLSGKFRIRKNGYPYYGEKRCFQHIEIEVLKEIRINLDE